jgi:hypothetical protein
MQILRAKMIEIESLFNFMAFPGSWLRSVESALYQPVGIVHKKTEGPEKALLSGGTKKVETYCSCGS